MTAIEGYERAQAALLAACGVEARRRFLRLPSVGRAQVLEIGEGPPVLFVIGGGGPGAMWAPLVARLPGYRRIVVDRPGFGLTDRVAHRRGGMDAIARAFLGECLDALGLEAATVVANSMGAWWSTRLALASPQRVPAMIHVGCPALLLDTSAPAPMRVIGVRGLGKPLVRLQGASLKSARRTFEMMGDPLDDGPVGQALAELMARMAQLPGYVEAWAELLAAFVRPRGQRPGMAIGPGELRRLEMPLLYVWGDRDPFGSQEQGRRAAAIAPNAQFVGIAGGHVPWVRDAEAVAAPIRAFLAEHVAGGGTASRRTGTAP